MDADDQNAAAGITGAGSGRPPATMRAVVLDAPGPPSALAIRELPVPVPSAGQVLIRVRAFGLNRLELYLRLGLSQGVTFHRVPGIEATGVVEQCPGGEFRAGQQVAALMGGMGRVFDGGYADFTCVPAAQVIPFRSDLDWATLGAVHGVVCFSGMLSNQWIVRDFYPLDYLPTGVRLTAYKGDAADLPPRVLQDFLDAVAAGTAAVPIGRVYRFDQILEAHTDMEQNRASGKLVVTT
jgi:NADPH:quinone reductase-like Zn-dependent oxidoreductase